MIWHSGSWVDKDLRKLCTSFKGMFYSVSAQAFHALRTCAGGCGAPQAACNACAAQGFGCPGAAPGQNWGGVS